MMSDFLKSKLSLYCAGGYGQYGCNSSIIYDADLGTGIVVDAGLNMKDMGFRRKPHESSGPKYKNFFTKAGRNVDIEAVIISHAHMDHYGGLPFLLKYVSCPIYGSPLTLDYVRRWYGADYGQEAAKALDMRPLNPGESLFLKCGTVSALKLPHSVPQTLALKITDLRGSTVLYWSDSRYDPVECILGETKWDIHKWVADCGQVDYMITDVTNASRTGEDLFMTHHVEPEEVVEVRLKNLMEYTTTFYKTTYVALFASSLTRLSKAVQFCRSNNLTYGFVGAAFKLTLATGHAFGYFEENPMPHISLKAELLRQKTRPRVLFVTGAQGQPEATLRSYLDSGVIGPGDAIIRSSSTIPTEECIRNSREMVTTIASHNIPFWDLVHVSGHAGMLDIANMVKVIRPSIFINNHADAVAFARMEQFLGKHCPGLKVVSLRQSSLVPLEKFKPERKHE